MQTARVIEEHKTNYVISDGVKEQTATVRGSFFAEGSFPKVGDYIHFTEVTTDKAVIEDVIPRISSITRRAVETGEPQVLVANVDTMFIVMGLDNDFNLSRLERYLLLATQSNVAAVVLLNKCDMVENDEEYLEQTKAIAGAVPVYTISAKTNHNMDILLKYLPPKNTAVLLGSSGAGKSTITNWLLNAHTQKVSEVRDTDDRGRHTTTSRQLFTLANGAFLIDTPGMRELALLDTTSDDEDAVFEQIEVLATQCTFSNCDHEKSQGCAILAALEDDVITERQLTSYQKLQRERLFEESKNDTSLSREQKRKQKKLYRSYDEAKEKKRFNTKL